MKLQKGTLRGSPFLGIFGRTTDRLTLIPLESQPKEKQRLIDTLGTELIPCTLANSSLLGVLSIGNQRGFLVSGIVEPSEIAELQSRGIMIERLPTMEAIGNLATINDEIGLLSPVLGDNSARQIEKILQIKTTQLRIANSDLVGSNSILTNKGFVCNPNTTPAELNKLEKSTRQKGNRTSANFGDAFIGNSALANSQGAVVGEHSTPHEMLAMEEAFSGEA